MSCTVWFPSSTSFNACSAPASVRKVVKVVVVDLLLRGLAGVWETFPWLALLLHLWVFVLTNLRRDRRRRDGRSDRRRHGPIIEEILQILLLNFIAHHLLLLHAFSQTFLEARATHCALSSRALVFGMRGSYEAANAAA